MALYQTIISSNPLTRSWSTDSVCHSGVWGKNFQCANLWMRMTSSPKCLRPIFLLYLSCFGLFVLQMGLLIQSRLHPEKTISSTELKKLGEIPFPAIFRICLKPAYNETFLRQAGYETAWSLFTGLHIFI